MKYLAGLSDENKKAALAILQEVIVAYVSSVRHSSQSLMIIIFVMYVLTDEEAREKGES